MFLLFALACAPEPLTPDNPVDPGEVPADSDAPAPDEAEPPAVEEGSCVDQPFEMWCGHGELGFKTILEDGDVEMVHGGQDGFHVPVAVMVRNAPQLLRFRSTVVDVATGIQTASVNAQATFVPLVPGEWACEGTSWGHDAALSVAHIPELAALGRENVALCGRETELTIEVSDPFTEEIYGTGRAVFRLQPDPADGPHCD